MSRVAFFASLLGLAMVLPTGAIASELGTAGPFRSLGGAVCTTGLPDTCAPPPVDVGLPRDQQVRKHVARALALFDLLAITQARSALDEALRLDPDDVQALTLRGRLNLGELHTVAAREDLEHALRLTPRDPYLLASFAGFDTPDQALKDFDAALAQKPDDTDILFAKARFELECGCSSLAYADLSRNLAISPNDERALLLRAQVGLLQHAFDLAIIDANRMLAAQPNNLTALQIKAAARLGVGDEAGAIETYSELLSTPDAMHLIFIPEIRQSLVGRGRLFAKQRRFVEARRDLDALNAQGGMQGVLQMQLYLRGHGFPNVELSGRHTAAFDTALNSCFSDTACGPNLFR